MDGSIENMRTKVFIGHANPEDNEFTSWLQSKLLNEGYDVVTDLSMLIGGEKDFWKNIQDALEQDAAKYVLVLSNHTFNKEGVIDEWEHAKAIEKQNNIIDFIIPLRIDDVPFDVRIGLNKRNIIPFHEWSKGLKKLLTKLHFDGVPKLKNDGLEQSIIQWSKNKFSTFSGVKKKEEIFYSNWLEIDGLPENLFFHRYDNDTQAQAVAEEESSIPIVQLKNHLITFEKSLEALNAGFGLDVRPKSVVSISTRDIIDGYESDDFPKCDDSRRLLIRVLKKAWEKKIEDIGLKYYELSGGRKCHYYKMGFNEKDKVRFKYGEVEKLKQLVGKMNDSFWHYAISSHVLLHPITCFSLKAHLLFSDDGEQIWSSKSKLHSSRRRKGKGFFNKEWRDLMLAFTSSLGQDGQISIPLSHSESLLLNSETITFQCDFGYDDPKDNARILPLDDYVEDEEIYDDIDSEEEE